MKWQQFTPDKPGQYLCAFFPSGTVTETHYALLVYHHKTIPGLTNLDGWQGVRQSPDRWCEITPPERCADPTSAQLAHQPVDAPGEVC